MPVIRRPILKTLNNFTTKIHMANKAPQNIELVHFDKQPINSNCLSLYQMTDEDTKNIEFPTNIFKLASNPTVLLENCFSEAEKVPHLFLAVKLAQLASFPLDKLSNLKAKAHLPEELSGFQQDNTDTQRLNFISFVGKLEVIRNSLVYMTIQDCEWKKGSSVLEVRNSKGELLFIAGDFKIQEADPHVIKKFQTVFKGGNTFVIINLGQNQYSMDCFYFEQFSKQQNNFLYIQNRLRIQTVYNVFDQDDTILYLNKNLFPNNSLYFIVTEKYGTIICSKTCLRFYLLGKIDQILDEHSKLKRLYEQQFHCLNIENQFHEYSLYIRSCILNLLLTNEYRKAKLTFKEAVFTTIKYLMDSADKAKRKSADVPNNKSSLHFPIMMKNCKECRVCLKKYLEKGGFRKKSQKKRLKEIQRNEERLSVVDEVDPLNFDSQPGLKIKKTKYSCQGCSTHYGKDVPICVLCFKQFHFNEAYFMGSQFKPQADKVDALQTTEKPASNQVESDKFDQKMSISSNIAVLSEMDEGKQTAEELVSAMKSFNSQLIDYITRLESQLQQFPLKQQLFH